MVKEEVKSNERIIQNILDNDLYKFSMSYAYMTLYPEAVGTFRFMDRGNNIILTDDELEEFIDAFIKEFSSIPNMSEKMMSWAVEKMIYIPRGYWEWLNGFRFDLASRAALADGRIKIFIDKDGHLHIEVTDRLYKVTLYEVPILAFVSEYFNRKKHPEMFENKAELDTKVYVRTRAKVEMAKEAGASFSEFGTRRRFSYEVQKSAVKIIWEVPNNTCAGTSNVLLAYLFNMTPIGTVAHEWTMFHGAMYGYRNANYMACEAWSKVFDGALGTALTDTYGTKAFFDNMSLKQAKLYDGIRQDSGDELEFAEKAYQFYKGKGVDPASKLVIFSNALDFPKYIKLYEEVKAKYPFKISAGIGTNLTNDVDVKPFNMVMKLMECKMTPREEFAQCIKISDDLGKHMGDEFEFEVAKRHLNL